MTHVRGAFVGLCAARSSASKLRVYAGAEHPHEAQQPEKLDIGAMNSKNTANKTKKAA